MLGDMFELSADEARREEQLLKTCRKTQGEHRPPDHSGWTTYSDDFIEAAAGLYRIYRTALENYFTRLAGCLGVSPSSRPPAVKVRPDIHTTPFFVTWDYVFKTLEFSLVVRRK